MHTFAKNVANQRNAQHSTGPTSEAGKAASSQNARKHGFRSKIVALSDSERPEFEALEEALRAQVRPQSPLEEIHFRELLIASWRLQCLNNLQSNATSSTALLDPAHATTFQLHERYRAGFERAIHRAMKALTQLQTLSQIQDMNALCLSRLHPNAPEELLTSPAFTDIGRVMRDAKVLPRQSNPSTPASQRPENLAFMESVNHIMRETGGQPLFDLSKIMPNT